MSLVTRMFTKTINREVRQQVDAQLTKLRSDNVDFFGHKTVVESILALPPVWCAVDFLSSTLASLPLHVYSETEKSRLTDDPVSNILGRQPASGRTSYDWRSAMWKNLFTTGRAITYIERDKAGRVRRLHWDIDPSAVSIKVNSKGDWDYEYTTTKGKKVWPANRVIDIAWMRTTDGLTHLSPVSTLATTFIEAFDNRDFRNKIAKTGGRMPSALKGRWDDKNANKAGFQAFMTELSEAFKEGNMLVPLGKGMEIVSVGMTPRDGQLMESAQFIVREVARIWNLPPLYLHSLDQATYNNAEQQGINLVKYTLNPWLVQFEQQLTLKLMGTGKIARHDLDGLLRGAYTTRVQGHATAIQTGQLTPNEARESEDRPPHEDGDELMIQSGTMPISKVGLMPEPQPPGVNENED